MPKSRFMPALTIALWATCASPATAQDMDIFAQVKDHRDLAVTLYEVANLHREGKNNKQACPKYKASMEEWDKAIAAFKSFVISYPTGPKERQAATLKEMESQRHRSWMGSAAYCVMSGINDTDH